MGSHVRLAVAGLVAGSVLYSIATASAAAPPAAGAIKGRVRLTGKAPGNPMIRMGVDPMCAKANAGKRVFQETVDPYFAITGKDGTFEIIDVPAGTYSIRAWHEQYGHLTASVRVAPGTTAATTFTYTGLEKS